MRLHVVSFQVPYPPDYGGAIDVYYKLKALREAGHTVVLHTYEYDHPRYERELREVCSEVHYYPRATGLRSQLSLLPYIVWSRRSTALLADLLRDSDPILFEGLHCCYFLGDERLRGRRLIVRMHNIEHRYYWLLARQRGLSWRTIYYGIEALRLRLFERRLRCATEIRAISTTDEAELRRRYPGVKVSLLPAQHARDYVSPQGGTQAYLLYHGNLGVEENLHAVDYILRRLYECADPLPYPLYVAGRRPAASLAERISTLRNVTLVPNPSDAELDALLASARVNLLLTFQPTGVKLKLMNALVKSRGYVAANSDMLKGSGVEALCERVNDDNLRTRVEQLMRATPSADQLKKRRNAGVEGV